MNKLTYSSITILVLIFSFNLFSQNKAESGTNLEVVKSVKKGSNIVQQDSLANQNRIERVDWRNETINVTLSLEDYNQNIQLVIYNMLAKPVKTQDYQATDVIPNKTYTFNNTSDLPQGHYFCILLGQGFQDTYKFVIKR